MKAFLFPGQGCQKEGMGKDLYDNFPQARAIFEQANDILGERFSDTLFSASEELLMDTRYTQPAIFIYQVALALGQNEVKPDCVAGHSLGEYAALVVAGVLSFEETLKFVKTRGQVFHEAFQRHPSAMGAIIGIPDEQVLDVLRLVGEEDGENLYIANYNGPGQLVITGARKSIKKACKMLNEMGAKRAFPLPMKGVGHSPNSAEEGEILAAELRKLHFCDAQIPVYQDADGCEHTNAQEILDNQVKLMTHPVQWTKLTFRMLENGVTAFYEVGPDDTLQKIVRRMAPEALVTSLLHIPSYEGGVRDYSDLK